MDFLEWDKKRTALRNEIIELKEKVKGLEKEYDRLFMEEDIRPMKWFSLNTEGHWYDALHYLSPVPRQNKGLPDPETKTGEVSDSSK